ncbi:uncharacterized protein LOC112588640 [Harpegnathos saltator]|uniref:uncharacterized protein LOC112588640 n=1 Tax=Harpegnathos saltator TaxID=610380 RepID=UPI000DBED8A7|nr:uncharacterized protein LOC112588640 [Harpegnathos saltator]
MFQPLADFYSQPVAVFASKAPVSGEVLAQLVIKAIALLENINVKVHGVITDGAATNRKFWNIVSGVSGKKDDLINVFNHPTVNGRYIYVFSDTPHLIRTIRNRLYSTSLQLNPDEKHIKWDYFRILYNKDKSLPALMRICP